MRDGFHADGERWLVRTDDTSSDEGLRTFVFHCLSNSSRPYRVVQVPENVVSAPDARDLREEELQDLFGRSHTMDFVHDTAAYPEGHGVKFGSEQGVRGSE